MLRPAPLPASKENNMKMLVTALFALSAFAATATMAEARSDDYHHNYHHHYYHHNYHHHYHHYDHHHHN
jgi:hypothetical protein